MPPFGDQLIILNTATAFDIISFPLLFPKNIWPTMEQIKRVHTDFLISKMGAKK